ncbi:MAG: hypothetical protein CL484_16325 [Acidobacteria bacterium]|nr:hypothetical protein [Acidobacteriota bacterium]|tara:strand:- start:652 stop:933 length:282 start_codon:yes stop_codon:yes gene_type:complete
MIVGLLSVELHLASARSLKDKRAVLRRLKARLGSHNIAISEIAHHELRQRAGLGIVTIGVNQEIAERTLDAALSELDRVEPGILLRSEMEWLT